MNAADGELLHVGIVVLVKALSILKQGEVGYQMTVMVDIDWVGTKTNKRPISYFDLRGRSTSFQHLETRRQFMMSWDVRYEATRSRGSGISSGVPGGIACGLVWGSWRVTGDKEFADKNVTALSNAAVSCDVHFLAQACLPLLPLPSFSFLSNLPRLHPQTHHCHHHRDWDTTMALTISNLLAIEFKRTEPLSLNRGLSDCMLKVYGEPPDNYLDDLRIFDELRADIVNLEPHQNALDRLLKYVTDSLCVCGPRWSQHLFQHGALTLIGEVISNSLRTFFFPADTMHSLCSPAQDSLSM